MASRALLVPFAALVLALAACSDGGDGRAGGGAGGRDGGGARAAAAVDPDEALAEAIARLESGDRAGALARITRVFADVRETGAQPDDPATLERLQRALAPLQPDLADPRLLVNATLALAVATDLGTARRVVFEHVEKEPRAYSALLALGHLAHASGHVEPAKMWFGRARLAAPARTEARMALGAIAAASRDLAVARECFDEVLARDADDALALLSRGNVHGELGDEARAFDDWQRAAALDDGETGASASNRVGAVLLKRGDTEGALAAFQRAMQCDPASASSALNAGQVLHQLGRADEARAALDRAAALRPEDPRPRQLLGAIAEESGDFAAAEAHYREALRLAPADGTLREALERLPERAGRADEPAHPPGSTDS